ncbi:MAG: DUF120 domain-containing protein [Methanothrix sp.]|nr:DUF120 domain-containing protein [Methanothrix sp.]
MPVRGKTRLHPFPGTLDVLLDELFPTELQAIQIEGFSEEDRIFGDCRCYPIKLNGMQAADAEEAVAAIRAGQTCGVGKRTLPRFFIGNTVQSI